MGTSGLIAFFAMNVILIGGMLWLTFWSKKYMTGVADFMSANRMARMYLLTVAGGMTGGSGIAAAWEMYYSAGFTPEWWNLLGVPLGLVVAVTGFIIYRFRETRSLTLAQFFEMRYSRGFRIYSGILSWVSGIVNFGIMPGVVARLFMDILFLPDTFALTLGEATWNIPVYPCLMAFNLTLAVIIACVGGQVSIMLTDFYQEIFCKVLLVLCILYLLTRFSWGDIFAGVSVNEEMVNPFNTRKLDSFNIWYFLIGAFGGIYNAKSWQGSSGYGTSARTPHDAQMSGVLARWRHYATQIAYFAPALIAYAVMHNAKFADVAQKVAESGVNLSDGKMVTTVFMAQNLPQWLYGAFAGMLIACSVSCDDTVIHSWGGIFVQDIVVPLRKTPMSTKTHFLVLRLSIVFVALFGFVFSLLFPLKDYIFMFYALTGAIYLGGAGIVIFGGLYTKWGTTAAAWVSMTIGSVLSFGALAIEQLWKPYVAPKLIEMFPNWEYLQHHTEKFPINGQVMYFFAMMAAILSYVIISFVFPNKKPFNLDKMLHRGEYKVADDNTTGASTDAKRSWQERIGYSKEFTKSDSILFWTTIGYCMFLWVCFITGTIVRCFVEIPIGFWNYYWHIFFIVNVFIMIAATIWLTIGGICNALKLPKELEEHRAQAADDGTVIK